MRIDSSTGLDSSSQSGGLAPTTDEFLRLFVAQLEHQDPLDPSDPTQMVSQLAQLSNVEQTAGLGGRLDALIAQQASTARASLLGLVGRQIDAPADQITIDDNGGTTAPVVADLPRTAASVTVIVKDAAGNEVRRIDLGPQPPGELHLLDGQDLPPGTYQLEVQATDAAGAAIDAPPIVHGLVDRIDFSDDGAHLHVGGLSVNPGDVSSVF